MIAKHVRVENHVARCSACHRQVCRIGGKKMSPYVHPQNAPEPAGAFCDVSAAPAAAPVVTDAFSGRALNASVLSGDGDESWEAPSPPPSSSSSPPPTPVPPPPRPAPSESRARFEAARRAIQRLLSPHPNPEPIVPPDFPDPGPPVPPGCPPGPNPYDPSLPPVAGPLRAGPPPGPPRGPFFLRGVQLLPSLLGDRVSGGIALEGHSLGDEWWDVTNDVLDDDEDVRALHLRRTKIAFEPLHVQNIRVRHAIPVHACVANILSSLGFMLVSAVLRHYGVTVGSLFAWLGREFLLAQTGHMFFEDWQLCNVGLVAVIIPHLLWFFLAAFFHNWMSEEVFAHVPALTMAVWSDNYGRSRSDFVDALAAGVARYGPLYNIPDSAYPSVYVGTIRVCTMMYDVGLGFTVGAVGLRRGTSHRPGFQHVVRQPAGSAQSMPLATGTMRLVSLNWLIQWMWPLSHAMAPALTATDLGTLSVVLWLSSLLPAVRALEISGGSPGVSSWTELLSRWTETAKRMFYMVPVLVRLLVIRSLIQLYLTSFYPLLIGGYCLIWAYSTWIVSLVYPPGLTRQLTRRNARWILYFALLMLAWHYVPRQLLLWIAQWEGLDVNSLSDMMDLYEAKRFYG